MNEVNAGREFLVLEQLVNCTGFDKGVSVADLVKSTGFSAREIRHAVTTLRLDGYGICAHPATGYFLAQNEQELDKYCLSFLKKRAMHTLKLISRISKTALPDLVGQLNLKT